METTREEEKLDIVTALTTPLQRNVMKKHAETLKRLKTQEKEIREQQRQIDELNFELGGTHAKHQKRGKDTSHTIATTCLSS